MGTEICYLYQKGLYFSNVCFQQVYFYIFLTVGVLQAFDIFIFECMCLQFFLVQITFISHIMFWVLGFIKGRSNGCRKSSVSNMLQLRRVKHKLGIQDFLSMFRQLFLLAFSFTSHVTLSSGVMMDLVMHQSRHTHILIFILQAVFSQHAWLFGQTKLFPIYVKCKTLNTVEESPAPSKSAKCSFHA